MYEYIFVREEIFRKVISTLNLLNFNPLGISLLYTKLVHCRRYKLIRCNILFTKTTLLVSRKLDELIRGYIFS